MNIFVKKMQQQPKNGGCTSCTNKCTTDTTLLGQVQVLKNYFGKIREQLNLGNVEVADAIKQEAYDYVADNIIVPLGKQKGDSEAIEETGEIINSLIMNDFGFDQKFVNYINSE